MNVAIDTNVLACAEGLNGAAKQARALYLLDRLPPESLLVPVQVLGELFNVLVHKAGRTRAAAAAAVLSWGDACPLIESSAGVILAATDLSQTHQIGIWDALVLSSAAEAHCRLLLSEDLQDGFTWRGVTVTNPFGPAPHPLLTAAIDASAVRQRKAPRQGQRRAVARTGQ